jgi:hypothetical protein
MNYEFVLQRFFFCKTQGLTFLSRNLYGYPSDLSELKFKNSEFAVLSLVTKNAVRCVLG